MQNPNQPAILKVPSPVTILATQGRRVQRRSDCALCEHLRRLGEAADIVSAAASIGSMVTISSAI